MNRSILILALACGVSVFQAVSAEAAGPKGKAGRTSAATSVKQSTSSKQPTSTITKQKPIIDPVHGKSTLNRFDGGKGSIDPGYFGGTKKPSFPITFGGNPPRGPSGSGFGVTFGGNPPRGPSQPSGDCHHGSHDHDCHNYCHHDNFHNWGWLFSDCRSNDCYGYDSYQYAGEDYCW